MNTEYASQKPEWVACGISYGVSDAWECKALAAVASTGGWRTGV